ncbi:hypothetical protein CC80DRAFT_519916 [Byssothecium circinans]|uniref:Integral membrane protein TmpA n=1 Tax=Byssothecium circinans TaxID=147558 RepID=A0A6A5TNJ0_9PLEO|nr:hypothetical protein CC80DRAFT_519916 [Byssothecium circinans]
MAENQWWERRTSHRHTPQYPAATIIPYPRLPPALDFDTDSFTSNRTYHTSSDLEKAILNPKTSYYDPASTTSTLTTSHDSTCLLHSAKYNQVPHFPPKRYPRLVRYFRYTLLTVYRRLFTAVFIGNSIPLILIFTQHCATESIPLSTLATAASSNFLATILIRQDIVINAIFRTAWLVPWSAPFRLRRWVAKCYCYGGIHSGAAVAGTMWWIAFSTVLTMRFIKDEEGRGGYTLAILLATLMILALLVIILVLAYPSFRERWHNAFEITHRFLGWTSILLFWIQLILLTARPSTTNPPSTPTFASPSNPPSSLRRAFATRLLRSPTFWNLLTITLLLIYPWLRLRKWNFTAEVLSPHAIRLRFTHPVRKFSCLSLSTSPLREWHPFATFPSSSPRLDRSSRAGEGGEETEIEIETETENSLIISSAGDWTRALITRARAQNPPSPTQISLYTKGHPHSGLLSLTPLFRTAILLTTGSGIGPALSSLLHRPPTQRIRLIWSTRSPVKTYGRDLYERVLRAEPGAVVIDSDVVGRVDLVGVVWGVWRGIGGRGREGDRGEGEKEEEAVVFVLSNRGITGRVVRGLVGRGVVALGPVWDS